MRILSYILIFAMAACAHQEPLSKSTRTHSSVTVQWESHPYDVTEACREEGAPMNMKIDGCAIQAGDACKIIAVEPSHWGDYRGLRILGHEFWHCAGAKHHE
jgi:azurin